ncbi:MAG TPA: type II toxin-antitoxin system prevent-host-death family antitoxin [Candidatus Acidoferrum sp.]
MRKVGVFEARQKLSELVRRAGRGETIGITARGKLTAMIVPAQQEQVKLNEVFARIEEIRKRSKKPKHVSVKELIEEGRT